MEFFYWFYFLSLYLLKFLHLCLLAFVFIGPFFLNKFWLLVLILYNIYVVTCWYILGQCLLTPFEESLQKAVDKYDSSKKTDKSKEKTDEKKSFISIFLEKQFPNISKNTIKNMFSIAPMMSTFVCLVRLRYMKK